MQPTSHQFELAQWHCAVLRAAGCIVTLDKIKYILGYAPRIIIFRRQKLYKFADPDWDVVNKQLACLVNICATI